MSSQTARTCRAPAIAINLPQTAHSVPLISCLGPGFKFLFSLSAMTRTLVPGVRTSERRSIPWSDRISPRVPHRAVNEIDPHDSMFCHDTAWNSGKVSTLCCWRLARPLCSHFRGYRCGSMPGLWFVSRREKRRACRCMVLCWPQVRKPHEQGFACARVSILALALGRKGGCRGVGGLLGLLPCAPDCIVACMAGSDSECTEVHTVL